MTAVYYFCGGSREIRPVNEARMRARWKLGQLLAKEERAKAGQPGKIG
jgi:hypothetical protein